MATDTLFQDFTARPFPFQQQVSFNASRYSTVPWGQAIVDENFQTPTISAGNDGLIGLDIDLPSDYVCLLRNFHLQTSDANFASWEKGVVGMAYQTPGGPYKTSVTEYPEADYSWYALVRDQVVIRDRFATQITYNVFNFGHNYDSTNTSVAFNDSWDPTQLPLWIPPTVDTTFKSRQMVIYLDHATSGSNVSATNATFRASFDLYTFDQAYSAAVMSSPRVFT
jgi:hypothetical protein